MAGTRASDLWEGLQPRRFASRTDVLVGDDDASGRASGLKPLPQDPRTLREASRVMLAFALVAALAACDKRPLVISGIAKMEDGTPVAAGTVVFVVTHARPLGLPPAVETITARTDLRGRFERSFEVRDAEIDVALAPRACLWAPAAIHYHAADIQGRMRLMPMLVAKP